MVRKIKNYFHLALKSGRMILAIAFLILITSILSLFVFNNKTSVTNAVVATGGTVTDVGGYRIHTFTSSGTFTVTTPGNVEVLVVAGGGGGSSGGGGAGGLIYNSSYAVTAQAYTVTVGGGGTGRVEGVARGDNGVNSVFGSLTAIGGGGGAGDYAGGMTGADGGSGGGGSAAPAGNPYAGGSGTANQGNAGGNNAGFGSTGYPSGGGGGAGSAGYNATSATVAGKGGMGLNYSISGASVGYAGGGGGCNSVSGTEGTATHGGGAGVHGGGTAGTANTGGGGGGAGAGHTGGNGGSGIVIIRYPIPITLTYRKPITIDNTSNASTLTDYQISITTDTAALVTAGKLQNDCDDLRFTSNDTSYNTADWTNNYPYWIESGCNTTTTKIWIKVDTIAASAYKIIYMYYGNASAAFLSNGDNTFNFFDDFSGASLDTNKWAVNAVNSITSSISSGRLRITEATKTGSTYWIYNNTDTGSQHQALYGIVDNVIIEWTAYAENTGDMGQVGLGLVDSSNLVRAYLDYVDGLGGSVSPSRQWIYETTDTSESHTLPETMPFKIVRSGTTVKFYINDVLKATGTLSGSPAKLAITVGAYAGYTFRVSELDNIKERKYTSSEPTVTVGSEQIPNTSPPISYWKLDEGSGATLADSIGSNTGTATGTIAAAGKYSNARSFNGSSDYIAASGTGLPTGSSARTIEAWVKTDVSVGTGDYNTFFGYGSSSLYHAFFLLQHANGNQFAVGIYGEDSLSNYVLSPNTWYHLAATLDGKTIQFFVNGNLVKTNTFTNTPNTVVSYTHIGRLDATNGYYWDGLIDDVRIYNYIRSPSQIAEDMANNYPVATGGTVTDVGGYRIHTFTSSGTFTVTTAGNVEVLVVAGGGGGGRSSYSAPRGCGGGGAGGLIYNSSYAVTAQAYSVIVGNGGSGGMNVANAGINGANGADSIFSTITAKGGGGGGGHSATSPWEYTLSTTGGSGGGGANSQNGATGTSGQGNNGGTATSEGPNYNGGGGGGAGAVGAGATSGGCGIGGNGVANSISGSLLYYAGGGGGGGYYNNCAGGIGGGGSGGGIAGTINTGGGGGGNHGADGGAGGSGIVIIRYSLSPPINSAPTISSAIDIPDPVNAGIGISFNISWTDSDSGDLTKIHICKTNAISTQTCSGGSWCDTSSFSNKTPASCAYVPTNSDSGTKSYYAFVCDDDNACSASTSGTFSVNLPGSTNKISLLNPATSGNVVSAIFDTGVVGGAAFHSILWQGTLNNGTVKFQLACSDVKTGPWNYYGPTSTGDYYQPAGPNIPIQIATTGSGSCQNKRYIRYKMFIGPSATSVSPDVDDVIINWSP